ncbi:hypothetical protein AQUCO_00900615v1 [Aquilegia coerulea]|uniref:Ubiquitinyl hydrolase 1 n=1 Tax=Aquilegia coerulea TaxID=218851 RepID=A0A2G5EEJ0_AQUCA|nr:hypothetical protein AQUCO_00900615v1 [Aquilegia coerulea]
MAEHEKYFQNYLPHVFRVSGVYRKIGTESLPILVSVCTSVIIRSKIFSYDEVVEKVAQQLHVDNPSKIRLTTHNYIHGDKNNLSDMLVRYNQISDILYYEVLDLDNPLSERDHIKILKLDYFHATKDEVSIHTIECLKLHRIDSMPHSHTSSGCSAQY